MEREYFVAQDSSGGGGEGLGGVMKVYLAISRCNEGVFSKSRGNRIVIRNLRS